MPGARTAALWTKVALEFYVSLAQREAVRRVDIENEIFLEEYGN